MAEVRPSNDAERAVFLDGIRQALGGRSTLPQSPELSAGLDLARICGPGDPLTERFTQAAESAGMIVHRSEAAALARTLSDLLRKNDCSTAVVNVADPTLAENAEQGMRQANTRMLDRHSASQRAHFEAHVSITDVDRAVADSGTLVLSTRSGRSRLAHLAAPLHFAILRSEQIIPDLVDLWQAPAEGRLPASEVLITGPSKTADIEGILITGVHGPRDVHIILI